MSENHGEDMSEMPEVIQLSKKAAMTESTQAAASQAAREEPRSLTPVFNALVREWRAEGRDIPLRHNPAAATLARGAA
ncbi:hypothetical protein ACFOSC_22530 [Streptantibioticus rubrisoli]|uniref:Uncharacterized protein n=1 Tax=Streptantibioticus rubrisoli TaxID=1387313 RepID=A0ABT1P5U1_9ACTN|nr:hypothetical protein [Streptantibioticus rubrisoli]MCQ4040737.1 hypothetical protein [Streptantibioticus rubrisoli]